MTAPGETAVLSGRGSAHDLLRMQAMAERSLVISTTRKCPLACAHCITSSGPGVAGPVLSAERAEIWAEDFSAMARAGLRHVSLTGGEPILALDAVGVITRRAEASGLQTYVVTSAAWATSPRAAARVVARAGPVSGWDIGADAWHAAEMPIERVSRALDAILPTGARVTVRMCETGRPDEDAHALDAIRKVVRGRVQVLRQSVRAIGRAGRALPSGDGLPRRPCVTSGLFVRADGSTGPCCAGLAYEAQGAHPFDYGRVRAAGDLHAAWARWRADPLLRVMRFAALAALEGWLPDRLHGMSAPKDPCEACTSLWPKLTRAEISQMATRAAGPAVAEKLAALERKLKTEVGVEVENAPG